MHEKQISRIRLSEAQLKHVKLRFFHEFELWTKRGKTLSNTVLNRTQRFSETGYSLQKDQ